MPLHVHQRVSRITNHYVCFRYLHSRFRLQRLRRLQRIAVCIERLEVIFAMPTLDCDIDWIVSTHFVTSERSQKGKAAVAFARHIPCKGQSLGSGYADADSGKTSRSDIYRNTI